MSSDTGIYFSKIPVKIQVYRWKLFLIVSPVYQTAPVKLKKIVKKKKIKTKKYFLIIVVSVSSGITNKFKNIF